MATQRNKTAPWDRKRPGRKPARKLSPSQKKRARASAKKAGRRYPNLVDNMNAAKRKTGTRKTTRRGTAAKKRESPARKRTQT